ncbi:unnamed protein product [Ambrosiozyma monospora]|uniref:Unnamed protein product n=1 Tax=Ambrosiozyma monospora TaxID=43982 RepID=A0ACB5T383_AMBMO|nr:unnamed protein product [Ambrosiozyma monospora]
MNKSFTKIRVSETLLATLRTQLPYLRPQNQQPYQCRCYSAPSNKNNQEPDPEAKQEATNWLLNFTADPKTQLKHFKISFARSSGAGGQHVNTTDSKAIIRMTKNEWYKTKGSLIHSLVFDEIMKNYRDSSCPSHKKFPFFTAKGDLMVSSERTRYRDNNLHDCLDKFVRAVKSCGEFKKDTDKETVEKWEERRKDQNDRRLNSKKMKKDKKQSRRKVSLDY